MGEAHDEVPQHPFRDLKEWLNTAKNRTRGHVCDLSLLIIKKQKKQRGKPSWTTSKDQKKIVTKTEAFLCIQHSKFAISHTHTQFYFINNATQPKNKQNYVSNHKQQTNLADLHTSTIKQAYTAALYFWKKVQAKKSQKPTKIHTNQPSTTSERPNS